MAQTLRGVLAQISAGFPLDLDLYDLPKNGKQGFTGEVEFAPFGRLVEQFVGGANGIGHRGVLLHRYRLVATTYEDTRVALLFLGDCARNDFLLRHATELDR